MARAVRKRSTSRYKTKKKPRGKGVSPEMRTGLKIRMSNYTSFPKAIQDRFIDGYEEAKSAYASGLLPSLPDMDDEGEVSDWRGYAKQAVFNQVRQSGTEREQLYLTEPNKKGEAFRKGIRAGVQVILTEEGSGRSDYGARYNPKRRRRNISAAELEGARRGGYDFSDRYISAVRRIKQGEQQRDRKDKLPSYARYLEKDHDGHRFWPVRTARGTHWHYTIKKYKRGWVVEFRRRDGKSARHFISPTPSASPKRTFCPSQKEAFRALGDHYLKGKYAAYKNPRRRR